MRREIYPRSIGPPAFCASRSSHDNPVDDFVVGLRSAPGATAVTGSGAIVGGVETDRQKLSPGRQGMPSNERVNFVFNSASEKWNLLSAGECNSVIELAEADAARWHKQLATHGRDGDVFKKYSMFIIDRNSEDPAIAWLPQRFKDKLADLN